jgi:hypothetical protein
MYLTDNIPLYILATKEKLSMTKNKWLISFLTTSFAFKGKYSMLTGNNKKRHLKNSHQIRERKK